MKRKMMGLVVLLIAMTLTTGCGGQSFIFFLIRALPGSKTVNLPSSAGACSPIRLATAASIEERVLAG